MKFDLLLKQGYLEMADESLEIMKEFELLDQESLKYINDVYKIT